MSNYGNPLLTRGRIAREATGEVLTVDGVINKTGFMLLALLAAFGYVWYLGRQGEELGMYMIGGLIGGLVLALVIIFGKVRNPGVILAYSVCEGLMLGAVSWIYEVQLPGIVMQAAMMTMGCFSAILLAYKLDVIRYSPGLAKFLSVAIGGIILAYLVSFIGGFFGMPLAFLHDSSPLSIGISIAVVIIATLSFVVDFEGIKWASENGVDKKEEWYCAFGLVVTLVWLYIEMLRLLSKLRNR